ncbi:MAG: Asp-tRNA(Asn)/Glu-tRNA(Gln) amidotransferase subunit GatC [Lautropia sp.]
MRKHNTLVPQDIDRLAELARIAFDDAEKAQVLARLNDVFDIFGQLREVDTDGVEPLTHPQAGDLRQRSDEVTEHVSPEQREEIQRVAPLVENGLYLVPKVIE